MRLVSTSAHIAYAHLEAIEEMGRSPSEYIRQAVAEKLERDKGFLPEIRRVDGEIEATVEGLAELRTLRDSLAVKHSEFVGVQMVEDARNVIVREFLSREHDSLETFRSVVLGLTGYEELGAGVLEGLADAVWAEFRGVS